MQPQLHRPVVQEFKAGDHSTPLHSSLLLSQIRAGHLIDQLSIAFGTGGAGLCSVE